MSVPPEPAGWRAIEALLWSILAVERDPTRFLVTVDEECSEAWFTPGQLARVMADHAAGRDETVGTRSYTADEIDTIARDAYVRGWDDAELGVVVGSARAGAHQDEGADTWAPERVAGLPSVPPEPAGERPRTPMATLRSLAGDMFLARGYGACPEVGDLYRRVVTIIADLDATPSPSATDGQDEGGQR